MEDNIIPFVHEPPGNGFANSRCRTSDKGDGTIIFHQAQLFSQFLSIAMLPGHRVLEADRTTTCFGHRMAERGFRVVRCLYCAELVVTRRRSIGLQRRIDGLPDRAVVCGDRRQSRAIECNRRKLADREGFEPSIRFPVYTRSRRAPSTTRPPVLASPDVGTTRSARRSSSRYRQRCQAVVSCLCHPRPGCRRCRRRDRRGRRAVRPEGHWQGKACRQRPDPRVLRLPAGPALPAQRWRKFGLRFSTKAVMPSVWSSKAKSEWNMRRS